jgi:hypothetical protein
VLVLVLLLVRLSLPVVAGWRPCLLLGWLAQGCRGQQQQWLCQHGSTAAGAL